MPEYVVFDVETTGLAYKTTDRIIEIATVRLDDDFEVIEKWETLINPKRDIGITDIHGIHSGDVLEAPTFSDLLGDIWHRFEGAIPVSHNLSFDLGFLTAEYKRHGYEFKTPLEGICTLAEIRSIDFGFKPTLQNCCKYFEIGIDQPHCAADDATACAKILEVLIKKWECATNYCNAKNTDLWRLPATPLGITRRLTKRPGSSSEVSELVSCVSSQEITKSCSSKLPNRSDEYIQLLSICIEDRQLDDDESEQLLFLAKEIGLSTPQQAELHRVYLSRVASILKADGKLTEAELYDYSLISDILGIQDQDAKQILEDATVRSNLDFVEDLSGLSVCFTGKSQCYIDGLELSKDKAMHLVESSGMTYAKSVTKKLDILVVSDPDSLSGKAKKAKSYGTRIIAERAFWPKLGISID